MVRAVDGVSFCIEEGMTFAVVGESGCGKTTLAKLILLLESPTHGLIRFRGNEVHRLRGNGLRDYKRSVQAVFQDPYSSLNPRMRVLDIVGEPLQTHEGLQGSGLRSRVYELLQAVGLYPTSAALYPLSALRLRLSLGRSGRDMQCHVTRLHL